MAGRNPFLRTIGILGSTAVDIGKDYTSNFSTLITDAEQVKQNVIGGVGSVKQTFDRMRNGNGPIKGLLDWFYTKEGETDMFDLDDSDSDFDPGYSSDDSDDEDSEKRGPGVLDMSGMKDVARGHINSMYKIAHKIAETQVANTSEIISTVNNRTAEIVAATNNINTTLLGISKKLDTINSYVNARTYEMKNQKIEDSLYGYDGKLTLGSVFEASKKNASNSGLVSALSLLNTFREGGMLTPEMVARLGFDFFLGDKKIKALGNQSMNEVGGKINDAIGQGVSDGLEKLIKSSTFKSMFGDLLRENRDSTFRSNIKNEYVRDAAVFDGMTRTSIVKIIPEYLSKIYTAISGDKLYVTEKGSLSNKQTNTFRNLVSSQLLRSGSIDYDDVNKFSSSSLSKYQISSSNLNQLNSILSYYIQIYMHQEGIIRPDKKWISPHNTKLVDTIANLFAMEYTDKTVYQWKAVVTELLMFLNSEPGAMNRFINNLTAAYDESFRNISKRASSVYDTWNVGSISKMDIDAMAAERLSATNPRHNEMHPPQNPPKPQDIVANGDNAIPNIIGRGPGDDVEVKYRSSIRNFMSDIATLLAASTKKIIGDNKFKSLKLTSNTPTPSFQDDDIDTSGRYDFGFDDASSSSSSDTTKPKKITYQSLSQNNGFQKIGSGLKSFGSAGMETIKGVAGNIRDSVKGPDGQSTAASEFLDKAGDVASNVGGAVWDATKGVAQGVKDKATSALGRLVNAKDEEQDDDRNTVSMISAMMQTAIENGNVSQDEKNNIMKMIDSLHNNELKNKLRTSVSAMLERSSVKIEAADESKNKTFSFLKLLLNPVKAIASGIRYLVPTALKGLRALFSPEFKQIKNGLVGIKEGFGGIWNATKEGISNKYNNWKEKRSAKKGRQQMAAEAGEEIEGIYNETVGPEDTESFGAGFNKGLHAKVAASEVSVEGVDEPGKGFVAKLLTKIYHTLKGEEDSALSKIAENTEEKKEPAEPQPENNSASDVAGAVESTISEGVEGAEGAAGNTGVSKVASAVRKAVSGGTTATAVEGAAGVASAATGAAGAAGVVGSAVKGVSTLFKIGQSVGKIAGSLGGIALAVGKILVKAVLLMSGFKAIMKTIEQFKVKIFKIVQILLKPINKIFNFINRTIKPILDAVGDVLSSIAEGLSGILDSVLNVLVPIMDNTVTPVLNALMPALDTIIAVLEPMFDCLSGVIDAVLVPIGGYIKWSIVPAVQKIGYAVQTIMGVLEVGFGQAMIPLGGIVKGVGLLLTGIGKLCKLVGGGSSLKEKGSQLQDTGDNMMESGAQMIAQGFIDMGTGVKGFVKTSINQMLGKVNVDEEEESQYIKNPNATEPTAAPGSVLDVSGGGDTYHSSDSHNNIWNISNVYGSGNGSQKSYGNAMGMADNGCGPVALADAYNRRNGTNVDGLSMANSMARGGAYNPSRGTNVGSFMNASSSLGMNVRAGGVTRDSLSLASPNNPITVVGSGSDFGTKRGNNHYMNVIGTDKYGGAYVSNPLTGRVDRRSANGVASSSLLGLYGSGDSSTSYSFPEAVSEALAELKKTAAGMLGLFTGKTKSDEYSGNMDKYGNQIAYDKIKEEYTGMYGEEEFNKFEKSAEELAMNEFKSSHPRMPGETEDEYKKRFNAWYTVDRKKYYMAQTEAYKKFTDEYTSVNEDGHLSMVDPALLEDDFGKDDKGNAITLGGVVNAMKNINLTGYEDPETSDGDSRSGGNGSVSIYSENGVPLYTGSYEPTVFETNITNGGKSNKAESPLHEFFSMTSGNAKDSAPSSLGYWYEHYNNPDSNGVGSTGDAHSGIDVNWTTGSEGKPLYSTTGGEVVQTTGTSSTAGNSIMWRDDAGFYHWYMHLRDKPLKSTGDKIDGGTLLGYVGNTGDSHGAHLHYSVHRAGDMPLWGSTNVINPLLYFNKHRSSELVGNNDTERVWAALVNNGMSKVGAAGIMGCWQEESGMKSNNLENSWQAKFGYEAGEPGDVKYTEDVNSGNESQDAFVHGRGNIDLVGYGLGQFTTDGKKQDLYNRTVAQGKSVDDLSAQVEMTLDHLRSSGLFDAISSQTDPKEANNLFMRKYEAGTGFTSDASVLKYYPWIGQSGLDKRRQNAVDFYNTYKDWTWDSKNATSPTGTRQTTSGFGAVNGVSDARILEAYNAIKSTSGKNTGTVKTEGDDLNLRSTYSLNGDILTTIPNGTKLELEYDGHYDTSGNGSRTRTWFKTTFDGKTGYVASDYIDLDESAADYTEKDSVTPTITKATAQYPEYQMITKDTMFEPVYANKDGTSSTNNDGNKAENSDDIKEYPFYMRKNALNPYEAADEFTNVGGALSSSGVLAKDNAFKTAYNKITRNIWGHGDISFDDDGTPTIVTDIPELDQSLFNDTSDADANNGNNFVINRIYASTNNKVWDERLDKIMKNTYNVRSERIETLLQKILDEIHDDNPDTKPTATSESLFTDETIPQSVQNLVRG